MRTMLCTFANRESPAESAASLGWVITFHADDNRGMSAFHSSLFSIVDDYIVAEHRPGRRRVIDCGHCLFAVFSPEAAFVMCVDPIFTCSTQSESMPSRGMQGSADEGHACLVTNIHRPYRWVTQPHSPI